jgi:hypothetical protein
MSSSKESYFNTHNINEEILIQYLKDTGWESISDNINAFQKENVVIKWTTDKSKLKLNPVLEFSEGMISAIAFTNHISRNDFDYLIYNLSSHYHDQPNEISNQIIEPGSSDFVKKLQKYLEFTGWRKGETIKKEMQYTYRTRRGSKHTLSIPEPTEKEYCTTFNKMETIIKSLQKIEQNIAKEDGVHKRDYESPTTDEFLTLINNYEIFTHPALVCQYLIFNNQEDQNNFRALLPIDALCYLGRDQGFKLQQCGTPSTANDDYSDRMNLEKEVEFHIDTTNLERINECFMNTIKIMTQYLKYEDEVIKYDGEYFNNLIRYVENNKDQKLTLDSMFDIIDDQTGGNCDYHDKKTKNFCEKLWREYGYTSDIFDKFATIEPPEELEFTNENAFHIVSKASVPYEDIKNYPIYPVYAGNIFEAQIMTNSNPEIIRNSSLLKNFTSSDIDHLSDYLHVPFGSIIVKVGEDEFTTLTKDEFKDYYLCDIDGLILDDFKNFYNKIIDVKELNNITKDSNITNPKIIDEDKVR